MAHYYIILSVIEKGWGERHPLSGVVSVLPKEYLILYAPRDEEELQVVSFPSFSVIYIRHSLV